MSEQLISVIIPAYNASKFISKAIDSVLNQTYRPIEIIVVDDGSKDNTKEIVKKYSNNVKYYFKENGGVSSARNYGMKKAQGCFFAFLDADDQWLPEKLEEQKKIFDKNSEIGLVGCGEIFKNESGLVVRTKIKKNNLVEELLKKSLYRNEITAGSTLMINKNIIDSIGYFDENLKSAEDWDFGFRIIQRFKPYFVEKALVIKNDRTSSVSSSENADEVLENDLKFLKKHSLYFRNKYGLAAVRKAFAQRYFSHCYAMLKRGYFRKARKSIITAMIYFPINLLNKAYLYYLFLAIYKKKHI